MLPSLGISETFGKAKIDYVNIMLLLSDTNQEVVWLDVTVEEVTGVHELYSLKLKTGIRYNFSKVIDLKVA